MPGRWRAFALACALGLAGCDQEAKPAAPVLDARLELLFDPSQSGAFYSADLSDIDAILIQILQTGGHESLRRAKMELADDGDRGVEALRRMVDRYRDDPAGVDYLRNAVDALALSTSSKAAPLLLELLEHGSESLRVQTMRALLTHPRPESFDGVLNFLASASEAYQGEACAALGKLDPQRAQALWLDWIEQDANPQLRQHTLPILAEIRDPQLILRVRKLLERSDIDRMTRLSLCACAVRAGDEKALEYLRENRASKNPTERDLAVRALAAAGRLDELAWTLGHEERASIRTLVVRAATEQGDEARARALLEQASNDSDPDVRQLALAALSKSGAAAALDQALLMLDSTSLLEVGKGVELLHDPMLRDEALAQRVWSQMRPRMESLDMRTTLERGVLVKILGLIPLPEATQALQQLALASAGSLENLRAQRFVLMQAVNAGPKAQDAMLELWRSSEDATLRLDALEALAAPGNARSRELLLAVLDDPRTSASEMVFVADRLVRIGPAREVAWQLKRAAPRISDERARAAFQGVLWRWYPAPKNR